jgi:hypothetical protein
MEPGGSSPHSHKPSTGPYPALSRFKIYVFFIKQKAFIHPSLGPTVTAQSSSKNLTAESPSVFTNYALNKPHTRKQVSSANFPLYPNVEEHALKTEVTKGAANVFIATLLETLRISLLSGRHIYSSSLKKGH